MEHVYGEVFMSISITQSLLNKSLPKLWFQMGALSVTGCKSLLVTRLWVLRMLSLHAARLSESRDIQGDIHPKNYTHLIWVKATRKHSPDIYKALSNLLCSQP